MDYLNDLNESQKAAVLHTQGPSMIIAGAGSGKTRVLTYRIAHLIKNGVDPFNILSLTFTNKAAKEMKERITKTLKSNDVRNIWMGTFHSVFARILRQESEKIGYPSNFTIYDTSDAKNLIKAIVKELNLDDKTYKPNIIYNRISNAKNNLISAKTYNANTTIVAEDRSSAKPLLGEIYKQYESRCFKAGAMDFDDLLFKTNVLLRNFPDLLFKYQDKFRYILVDEFQDTNFSQYTILKQLAARFENITVVGDDAQSIYAFRGANIQNILNFKKTYSDTAVFKLEQNYRSTKIIVNAANSIIKNNKEQLDKNIWTDNVEGEKIEINKALTDNEEGYIVANKIFDIQNNAHAAFNDFAILYRTNSQSRAMEESLRKKDIPYKIYGGLSFYQRKEIKDLISYYRLVINSKDEEAFKRIINYPARGIGKTTIDRLMVAASEHKTSLWNIACNIDKINTGVSAGARNKIEGFTYMIKGLITNLKTQSAFELGTNIAKSSGILKELYVDKSPEGVSRYENIQELLNALNEFSDDAVEQGQDDFLDVFMQDVALLTDADNDKEEDKNKVTLMTIHAAKGLEFPYVFIVGMEENLFPSQMALNTRQELEEERRLFYVALTRAETRIMLSFSTSRYKWGNLLNCEPSRFLEEIDSKFTTINFQEKSLGSNTIGRVEPKTMPTKTFIPDRRNLKKVTNTTSSTSTTDNIAASKVVAGMEVEHIRFGKGKVLQVEGNSPNQKATIFFQNIGQKQLLLKFAKLTMVE